MSKKLVRSLEENASLADILTALLDEAKPVIATGVHTDGSAVTREDVAIVNRGRALRDAIREGRVSLPT